MFKATKAKYMVNKSTTGASKNFPIIWVMHKLKLLKKDDIKKMGVNLRCQLHDAAELNFQQIYGNVNQHHKLNKTSPTLESAKTDKDIWNSNRVKFNLWYRTFSWDAWDDISNSQQILHEEVIAYARQNLHLDDQQEENIEKAIIKLYSIELPKKDFKTPKYLKALDNIEKDLSTCTRKSVVRTPYTSKDNDVVAYIEEELKNLDLKYHIINDKNFVFNQKIIENFAELYYSDMSLSVLYAPI